METNIQHLKEQLSQFNGSQQIFTLFPLCIGVVLIGGHGKAGHFTASIEEGDLGVFPHISD